MQSNYKKGGFKKYSMAQKLAYFKKKAAAKGGMVKKGGIYKAKYYPKKGFGLIKSIENVVRNMGPPRNVASYMHGSVESVPAAIQRQVGVQEVWSTYSLASGAALICMTGFQSNADTLVGNSAAVGVFPQTVATGIHAPTTSEFYVKKMKTRLIIQPDYKTTPVGGLNVPQNPI